MTPPLFPISVSVVLALSSVASAATDWYLCSTDLHITKIQSPRIESGTLYYLDSSGFEVRRSMDDIFFALPDQTPPPRSRSTSGSGSPAWLTMTDNQHFPILVMNDGDPHTLSFTSVFNNAIRSVDLEHVSSLTTESGSMSFSEDDDLVVLTNGDHISGFIESINLSVTIDTSTGLRTYPLDQTQLVRLANNPQRTQGVYLHLDTETRLRATDLAASANNFGSATITGLGTPEIVEFESHRFGGLGIVHNQQRLVALTSLDPLEIEPTGERAWTPEPKSLLSTIPHSGLGDLDLRSPVSVTYVLEPGATSFACTVDLVAGPWSDCTLIVESMDAQSSVQQLDLVQLNPDNQTHRLLVDFPQGASRLIIRIEPGKKGPIQDRVILRRPRLLIESQSTQFE